MCESFGPISCPFLDSLLVISFVYAVSILITATFHNAFVCTPLHILYGSVIRLTARAEADMIHIR